MAATLSSLLNAVEPERASLAEFSFLLLLNTTRGDTVQGSLCFEVSNKITSTMQTTKDLPARAPEPPYSWLSSRELSAPTWQRCSIGSPATQVARQRCYGETITEMRRLASMETHKASHSPAVHRRLVDIGSIHVQLGTALHGMPKHGTASRTPRVVDCLFSGIGWSGYARPRPKSSDGYAVVGKLVIRMTKLSAPGFARLVDARKASHKGSRSLECNAILTHLHPGRQRHRINLVQRVFQSQPSKSVATRREAIALHCFLCLPVACAAELNLVYLQPPYNGAVTIDKVLNPVSRSKPQSLGTRSAPATSEFDLFATSKCMKQSAGPNTLPLNLLETALPALLVAVVADCGPALITNKREGEGGYNMKQTVF
ncbi:hypothetical protein CDEST_05382 [Colletotrichum destructivum]|uniref:Uncharacterized protein n=1 Tax=Colletotrichum destructivum TaxID=34406 RepID=A0AAX4IBR1_9PEZI|nr:hypothetical protein CDEST_05382 [Colletotrichum destructivum]